VYWKSQNPARRFALPWWPAIRMTTTTMIFRRSVYWWDKMDGELVIIQPRQGLNGGGYYVLFGAWCLVLLCLSGIRPDEVDSLKAAYKDHMEWLDDQYDELSASETQGSLEFDCGRWARLVGRKTAGAGHDRDIETMSELAVS
jgi:hypothetical protein